MARTIPRQQRIPVRKGPHSKDPTPIRGGPRSGEIAVDVVGSAKDQCYKFEVKSNSIKGTHTGKADVGAGDCVEFSGAAVEDGTAVFVLCCLKKDGKCTDCSARVRLQVVDGSNTEVAFKEVTVTCKPTS